MIENFFVKVEVVFFGKKRKTLPLAGYRPDITINNIADSYWGITFTELNVMEFDVPYEAKIHFTFQKCHYSEIEIGQCFKIMEGLTQVGKGQFISIETANSY